MSPDRSPSVTECPQIVALVCPQIVALSPCDGMSPDPCDTHATLTGTWRHPDAEADPNHCDTMAEGWYTFLLDGKEKAKIPTQCMQVRFIDAQNTE